MNGKSAALQFRRHRAAFLYLGDGEVNAFLFRRIPKLHVFTGLRMLTREIPHTAVFDRGVIERKPESHGSVLRNIEIVIVLMPANFATRACQLIQTLMMD